MNISDLQIQEKVALIALLAEMIDADGEEARAEAVELLALGEEMQSPNLRKAVVDSREFFESKEAVLNFAGQINRSDVRELVRTILIDLANADGFRGRNERRLLDELFMRWARN